METGSPSTNGAMTLEIMTLSIMTFAIFGLNITTPSNTTVGIMGY